MTVKNKLTAKQILDHMKARLAITQANYLTSPTAFYWNILLREQFVYQQMYFMVYDPNKLHTIELDNTVERINEDDDNNWGDIVCRTKLGMSVSRALEEYGHYTW